MFGKKKEPGAGDPGDVQGEAQGEGVPPLKPFTDKGAHQPSRPASRPALRPDISPRRTVDIPGAPKRSDRGERVPAGVTESKKLIVGRDIHLKGEITSCDRLVVEGYVEASLADARQIEVAPTGMFKGDAEVVEADISGRFEGQLTARQRLTVRATGRFSGKIRYGRIVIEAGGQISGATEALDEREAIRSADDRGEDADETADAPAADDTRASVAAPGGE